MKRRETETHIMIGLDKGSKTFGESMDVMMTGDNHNRRGSQLTKSIEYCKDVVLILSSLHDKI